MTEKDLKFQQTLTIAKATEAAEKEARDLQQPATVPVNSIHGEREFQPVSYLGWHATDVEASIKPQTVNTKKLNAISARKNHISSACRNKQRSLKFRSLTTTHQLLTATTDEAEPDEYSLYHTKGPGTIPPILVTLQLNGQNLSYHGARHWYNIVNRK